MSFDPDSVFHDGDASTIDKAIAGSVIAPYVSGKLQTLAGHFESAEPNEFAAWYQKWGQSPLPVEDVPGFTNRTDKQKPIKLRLFGTLTSISVSKTLRGATFEAVVHEVIHLNSNQLFRQLFGFTYNEAVTEYFTLKVFSVSKGQGHKDKLFLADGLISAVSTIPMSSTFRNVTIPWVKIFGFGERDVATAYFRDPTPLYNRILNALRAQPGNSVGLWKQKSFSSQPQDWKVADQLLQTAMTSLAGVGSTPRSGSSGSGSKR
jgi:hypothetical protein